LLFIIPNTVTYKKNSKYKNNKPNNDSTKLHHKNYILWYNQQCEAPYIEVAWKHCCKQSANHNNANHPKTLFQHLKLHLQITAKYLLLNQRGIEAKFLWLDALPVATSRNHSLDLIFSLITKTPKQGRDVTPFTSALRRQYLTYT